MSDDVRETIRSQSFFDDLPEEFVEILAACAVPMEFHQGHFLLTEGGAADRFFIIQHGKIAIEMDAGDKGPVTIQTLTAGDILGWSWLIPPYKWRFDAIAIEPVTGLAFDAVSLRRQCDQMPRFGYEMVKRIAAVMAYRLFLTRTRLMDAYPVQDYPPPPPQ